MADMELVKASKNLENATAQLRDFNESAGKDIALQIGSDLKKGVLDPFTNAFATIPGVSTLGAVGQTLFNKTFAALKEKREQNLLRQRLGLTKEQFAQMKYQKSVMDAQKEYGEQLKSGAENLLGLNLEKYDIETGLYKFGDTLTRPLDSLIGVQKQMLGKQDAQMARDNAGASARIEEENRRERGENYNRTVFERIAASIDGLAEGIQNIKAEDVGKGLLAPIGLIGGIIVSFVGGFVAEVKKQFAAIKLVVGGGMKGFATLGKSIGGLIKAITPNFILNFFSSIKNTLAGMKTLLTGGLTKIGRAADIAADSTKIGDIFRSFRNMVTGVKNFFLNSKFFTGLVKFKDLLLASARGIAKPFQSLFSMIKSTSTTMAAMAGKGGMIGKIMSFAKGFGSVLGKLFLPVTIVMSAFDFITGFIDGFKESEGNNIVSKFIDGVGGGLSKLIGNLIGIPLDLLKSAVSWILGKLGFDGAVKFLEGFSFKDLLMSIVKAPWTLVSKAVDFIKDIFTSDDPIKTFLGGMKALADGAKNLLKGLLRMVLPNPKGNPEDGKIMRFIKTTAAKVIPDGVYKFAGIDPETGDRIMPKVSDQQFMDIQEAGLGDQYAKAKAEGDADTMESLINESAAFKEKQQQTIINNFNNTDNSIKQNSQTLTTQSLTDGAAMVGAR